MSDAESDDIGNDDELGAFEPGFQDDDNIKNDQRELFLADSPDVKAESQASRSSSRKRSHAEMDVVVKERDSSATMQQSSDQSEAIIHAAARANRDNVNVQDKTGPLSESQTSASGQDSSVDSRAMPPPPPRLKDAQPDESVSIGEPDDELEAFHWDGLTERYHAKIREFDKIDEEIMREFEQLCNVSSQRVAHWVLLTADIAFQRLGIRWLDSRD